MSGQITEQRLGLFDLDEQFHTTELTKPQRQNFEEYEVDYQEFQEAQGEPWLYEDDPSGSSEGREAGRRGNRTMDS